jgi:uncharacterized protein (DUF362 family)
MKLVQNYSAIKTASKLTAYIGIFVKRKGVQNVFKKMQDDNSFDELVVEIYETLPPDVKLKVSLSGFKPAMLESRNKILKSKKGIKLSKSVA